MIEIDIPTIDPIQHEAKIFLGMTARQCICSVIGGTLGVVSAVSLYGINSDLAIIVTGLCVVPAIFMGWYKPYNMKCEDYVKLVYFNTFIANPKRIYKTDAEDEVKLLTMKERKEKEARDKAKAFEDKKAKALSKKKKGDEL